MRRLFLIISIITLSISILASACAIFGSNPEKQLEKFLTAVQKKDFKTIFDNTYYYQMELSKIKSNNPKSLWQKLTTEYYESKKKALFKEEKESLTDAWIRFGGNLFDTPTDPIENIRALMSLLNPPNKWKLLETKNERRTDQWDLSQRDVFVVYVSLNYNTVENSPLIDSKLLKETIISFDMDAKTGLYMRSNRVGRGDVYWDKVPFKILNISWDAEGLFRGLDLDIKVIGGLPPFTSVTKCGGWIIEKMEQANVTSRNDSVFINLRARFPDEYFPLQCIVSVTDKSGQIDTATFTVPEMLTGPLNPFCWIANPWYQWGQGQPEHCRHIFELKKIES